VSTSLLCKSQRASKYSSSLQIGVALFHWVHFPQSPCDPSSCYRRRSEPESLPPSSASSPLKALAGLADASASSVTFSNASNAAHLQTKTIDAAFANHPQHNTQPTTPHTSHSPNNPQSTYWDRRCHFEFCIAFCPPRRRQCHLRFGGAKQGAPRANRTELRAALSPGFQLQS
jgi:hypothetical protein